MSLQRTLDQIKAEDGPLSASRLTALSGLTPEEMRAVVQAWSAASTGRRRQVIAALIELAEDNVELDFGAVFRHALQDEDDEVRAAAIGGLWESEERWLIEPLIRFLRQDPSERVRAAAAQALGRFAILAETGKLRQPDGQRVGRALTEAIDDDLESLEVRRRAIEAVAAMSLPQVPEIIQAAYEHEDPRMRASALFAMGRTCDPCWLPALRADLDSEDSEVRFEAAGALGALGDDLAVVDLIAHINDPDPDVQDAVVNALGAIGGPIAKKALVRAAESADPRVAEMATEALQTADFGDDPLGLAER